MDEVLADPHCQTCGLKVSSEYNVHGWRVSDECNLPCVDGVGAIRCLDDDGDDDDDDDKSFKHREVRRYWLKTQDYENWRVRVPVNVWECVCVCGWRMHTNLLSYIEPARYEQHRNWISLALRLKPWTCARHPSEHQSAEEVVVKCTNARNVEVTLNHAINTLRNLQPFVSCH